MWETLSKRRESDESSVGRRSFLGVIGAAGVAGMAGTAAGRSEETEIEIRKEESEADSESAAAAAETEAAERVLSVLVRPEVRTDDATRTDVYLNDEQMGYTVNLPFEYGKLAVTYDPGGEIANAGVSLSPSEVPAGVRGKLSRGLPWPESESGRLMTEGPDHPVLFSRGTTDSEIERAKDHVDESSAFVEMIGLVNVTGEASSGELDVPESGAYVATFEDATYVLNAQLNRVLEETTIEELLGASTGGFSTLVSTCDSKAATCAVDVVMAVPHCTLATVGCGLTGVGALGCFVLLLSLCAPNLTLIGLSGACTYVARNCL
ncbi:hypothetical protein E2L06_18390 [Haloterrigena sp. H1]|uniref:hypothetical protein n=1 Tax=Haloterrigena sp. H1 TaxID=2552943 RepID=UPI0014873506|nr:hypothetical protein [Haloterrigena sp. H1]TMT80228.1 hypothetical protein E2L06_18390 [Haloterrigena sp. H1]